MDTWTYLGTVSDRNIERILADPELIWDVITVNETVPPLPPEPGLKGAINRMLGKHPQFVPDPNYAPGERKLSDIGDTWLTLHYLLTGTAEPGAPPLNFLLHGGRQVGDLDVGDGPARAFGSAETLEISGALARVKEETVAGRYDAAVALDPTLPMRNRPAEFDEEEEEEDWPSLSPEQTQRYVYDELERLRRFIRQTAASGNGFILWRADPPEDEEEWFANIED